MFNVVKKEAAFFLISYAMAYCGLHPPEPMAGNTDGSQSLDRGCKGEERTGCGYYIG